MSARPNSFRRELTRIHTNQTYSRLAIALLTLLLAAGCRSHVIHVSVTNTSAQPISTIIVDYPDATFGINLLAPGKTFQYVIKPTGAGAVKVQFTDFAGASHSAVGPTIHRGDEGGMQIKLAQDSATFGK